MKTTEKTNTVKNGRKNKQWLRNPDQLKHPKIFSVKMLRNKDGSFHVIGGATEAYIKKNAVSGEWHNVDTRDFVCELRNSAIKSF